MRRLLTGLCLIAAAAWSEDKALDFGVVAEVVRSVANERNAIEIQANTNLMVTYRELALQQELAREAARRGLTETLAVQRAIELSRRNVLVTALRNDVAAGVRTPTDQEIRDAFRQQGDRLRQPEGYRLDVYRLGSDQAEALAYAASLATGKPVSDEDLADLPAVAFARQTNEVWFTAANMTSNVWAGLESMEQDEVRLFPDGTLTLVIRRGERRDARNLRLDEARPLLRENLLRERAEEAWRELVEETTERLER